MTGNAITLLDVLLQTFREECAKFYFAYAMSDDVGVWERGTAQYSKLLTLGRSIADRYPPSIPLLVKIWNEEADKQFVPGGSVLFYTHKDFWGNGFVPEGTSVAVSGE